VANVVVSGVTKSLGTFVNAHKYVGALVFGQFTSGEDVLQGASEATLHSASAQLGVATANQFPQITLNAGFTPTSGLVENDRRTPEWDGQFRRAAEIAYTQLQLLVGSNYGVSWIYSYTPTDELRGQDGPTDLLPPQLRTGQVVLEPGEHPFPTKYAIRRSTMRIQPSIYLDALVRDFLLSGGSILSSCASLSPPAASKFFLSHGSKSVGSSGHTKGVSIRMVMYFLLIGLCHRLPFGCVTPGLFSMIGESLTTERTCRASTP